MEARRGVPDDIQILGPRTRQRLGHPKVRTWRGSRYGEDTGLLGLQCLWDIW